MRSMRTISGKVTLYFSLIIFLSVSVLVFFRVRQVNREIVQRDQKFRQAKKNQLKDYVGMIYNIIDYNHRQGLSQEETLEAVRQVRFSESGYFFIYRMDGFSLMVAEKPEVERKLRENIKDKKGNYIVRDMIKVCREQGEGFTRYYFDKPGKEGVFLKMAYVKRFEPWNWFIGTGAYFDDIDEQIAQIHQQLIRDLYRDIALLVSIFLILFLIMIFLMRTTVSQPIAKLKNYILRLGQGELPEEVHIETGNEVELMTEAINKLTANLKNTRRFATEVGKGHFKTDVDVFNNKGDLGGALVSMRDSLYRVAREREQQQEIERQHNWTAQGLAKFAELLREDYDELKSLTQQITKQIVWSLEAAQGAFFLINDNNLKEKFIEMISCFAYNRQKIDQKRIPMGIGLLGRAIQEEQYIYLTDIPDDYLNIRAGMGQAQARAVLIVPLKHNNDILGVVELASFKELTDYQIRFVEKIAEMIAANIKTFKINQQSKQLLAELQRQSTEAEETERVLTQQIDNLQQACEDSRLAVEKLEKRLQEKETQVISLRGKIDWLYQQKKQENKKANTYLLDD